VLEKAGIQGPFVLVGHSMAVWPLAVYARAHPEEVAGVVLVDPRAPHVSAEWRAALPPSSAAEAPAVTANREELGAFEHDPSMNPEHLDLTASAAEANAALDRAEGSRSSLLHQAPRAVSKASRWATISWA